MEASYALSLTLAAVPQVWRVGVGMGAGWGEGPGDGSSRLAGVGRRGMETNAPHQPKGHPSAISNGAGLKAPLGTQGCCCANLGVLEEA